MAYYPYLQVPVDAELLAPETKTSTFLRRTRGTTGDLCVFVTTTACEVIYQVQFTTQVVFLLDI